MKDNGPTTNGPDLYAQVCHRIRAAMGDLNDDNLALEALVADLAHKVRSCAEGDGGAVPVAKIRHFHYSGIARNGFSQEAQMLDGTPELPDGTELFTHPPAQAAQVDKPPKLGGCCCGEPCVLGSVHRTDGPCFVYDAPTAEPAAQGEAVAFKHPAAVRSAATFLLGKFEHAPCDSSGVSCCIRCSAVAISRWAVEALDASLAAQPRAVPDGWRSVTSALVSAAELMISEIDTCGHEVDPAYRLHLYEAKDAAKALLAAARKGESA